MTDPNQTSGKSETILFTLAQIQHLMRVEFSRAQRYSYPIVCLIVAVDQLGQVRDRFGYDAKEVVLTRVVELLAEKTRTSDFLGRLPDDRLMIIVPHTPVDAIEIMATRLVERAAELSIPVIESEALTFSIGGSWMMAGETLFFDDLMQTAESCVLEAAMSGGSKYISRAPAGLL